MSSLIHSLSDLAYSVLEVISSVFQTIFNTIYNAFAFVAHFAAGIVNMALEFFKGLIELAGGVAQFILGNIVILGVIAAAFFGFLQYQRNQGRSVKIGDKKLN